MMVKVEGWTRKTSTADEKRWERRAEVFQKRELSANRKISDGSNCRTHHVKHAGILRQSETRRFEGVPGLWLFSKRVVISNFPLAVLPIKSREDA